MQNLERILAALDAAFTGGVFDAQGCMERLKDLPLDESHIELLERINGFYAFDTSLHLYGCSEELTFHDLANRNALHPWRVMYGKLAVGLTFFAEEVFGNQFAYSRKGILMFDVETGDKTLIAGSFGEWVRYIDSRTDYATGRPLARQWSAAYGPIPYGHHLCPKKPFVMGGEFRVENLYLLPWERSLSLRADIARQIQNLPEGTPVVLKTVE